MDLEQGYSDNPEFDNLSSTIGNDLFHISSINGQISDTLRKTPEGGLPDPDKVLLLVHKNQQKFRNIKPEMEALKLFTTLTDSQKYSQSKLAVDFGNLFTEFKRIQQTVLEKAHQPQPKEPEQQLSSIDLDYHDEPIERDIPNIQSLAYEEQLRQDEISYQAGLAEEREEEIENIYQGMNELNEIYMNLGAYVTEQGKTIDNIESNVFRVNDHAQRGEGHLRSAARRQRSNTGRSLCFLMILLVFALIIIVALKL